MLVLFMVLLKGFVPQGYMPDMDALKKGIVSITICTASGFEEKLVDGSFIGKASPTTHHKAASDFCPFGWTPHAVVSQLSLFFLPELFSVPASLLALQELFLRKTSHSLASPRAPPVGA